MKRKRERERQRVKSRSSFFWISLTKKKRRRRSHPIFTLSSSSLFSLFRSTFQMSALAAQRTALRSSLPSAALAVPRTAVATAAAPRLALISTPSTSSSPSLQFPFHQCRRRRSPDALQATPWSEGVEPPTSAETARTIVDITAHGTLCTSGSDGVPLGKF